MKKLTTILILFALLPSVVFAAPGRPGPRGGHHGGHHGGHSMHTNDWIGLGVGLAVIGTAAAISASRPAPAPQPVIVTPPPAPRPVIVHPQPVHVQTVIPSRVYVPTTQVQVVETTPATLVCYYTTDANGRTLYSQQLLGGQNYTMSYMELGNFLNHFNGYWYASGNSWYFVRTR